MRDGRRAGDRRPRDAETFAGIAARCESCGVTLYVFDEAEVSVTCWVCGGPRGIVTPSYHPDSMTFQSLWDWMERFDAARLCA